MVGEELLHGPVPSPDLVRVDEEGVVVVVGNRTAVPVVARHLLGNRKRIGELREDVLDGIDLHAGVLDGRISSVVEEDDFVESRAVEVITAPFWQGVFVFRNCDDVCFVHSILLLGCL